MSISRIGPLVHVHVRSSHTELISSLTKMCMQASKRCKFLKVAPFSQNLPILHIRTVTGISEKQRLLSETCSAKNCNTNLNTMLRSQLKLALHYLHQILLHPYHKKCYSKNKRDLFYVNTVLADFSDAISASEKTEA